SVHYYPEISSEDISEGGEGTVDWGDGTSEGIGTKWSGGFHAYPTPGDYIITVTDNSGGKIESVCCYKRYRYGYPIAMKVGASFVYDDGLGGKYIDQVSDFKYIQISSDYIWNNGIIIYGSPKLTRIDFMGGTKPNKLLNNQFRGCNALDFENLLPLFSEVTEIGNYVFNACYNLKKLSLPKCTKVGNNSIYQCSSLTHVDLPLCTEIGSDAVAYNNALREVNMPLCATVGNYGLSSNYSLNKVTLAESCTFGSNALSGCYCLIPTPNGIYLY
ncbi:MAG: leucine-rich repeat protein, partial [Oscillospiraceae bacterium]